MCWNEQVVQQSVAECPLALNVTSKLENPQGLKYAGSVIQLLKVKTTTHLFRLSIRTILRDGIQLIEYGVLHILFERLRFLTPFFNALRNVYLTMSNMALPIDRPIS